MSTPESPDKPSNFLRELIEKDVAAGTHAGRVATRFPPEPNGYLHIGHAKSIWINFGLAQDFHGTCNLRFDDTNPEKEDIEYAESIKRDVEWLGYRWAGLYHASDYFGRLYDFARELIEKRLAYVCSLTEEEIRQYRGTVKEPGRPSPDRERPTAESLDLMERMKKGEFPDAKYTVRAKIDMASPNMKMRDPLMYRIRRVPHWRTADAWNIYPMYDYAHGLSDAIENITHSFCTLEFENNRELYDWFVDNTSSGAKPRQYEFARLNLSHTVMSKRRLLQLVKEGHVDGWDDPRMPTISGLRRRGVTPEAIRDFCERIGVARKDDSLVDVAMLEHSIREDLNRRAQRVMAVIDPLKVVIDNYPDGQVEDIECENNPEDPTAGTRPVPFSRELYIEREDFMENPPKKYFRLFPGGEVRLKHAYFVKCVRVEKDASGKVVELGVTYDPSSRGGEAPDGRKVKGTLHWVSVPHAKPAKVRLYEHLFRSEDPAPLEDWLTDLNPDSVAVKDAFVEPSLAGAPAGRGFQFMRLGYFAVDSDSGPEGLVFNRTVGLRDSWAKAQKTG